MPSVLIEPNHHEDLGLIEPSHQLDDDMDSNGNSSDSENAGLANEYLNGDLSSDSYFSDTNSMSSSENLKAYCQKFDPFEKDIYLNSNIKYKHFVGIYIKEFVDLDISNEIHNKFLKFLRVILPSDGLNIPKTYKSLVKTYNLPKVKNKKLCAKCSKELEDEEECKDDLCIRFKNNRENRGKKDPILVEFDIKEQLKSLIPKHWKAIQDYRIVLNSNKVSDICNSKLYNSYHLDFNSISILLFIDGAPFSKSEKGSVWAILGIIANLPPLIRSSFKNMLKICFINGRLFNFNGIFDIHLSQFKNSIVFGVKLKIYGQTILIKVHVHALIADNLARAKAGNTMV